MLNFPQIVKASTPWNKGKLIGQKPPLKLWPATVICTTC